MLSNHTIVFICGLHRSGTSILHEVLRQQSFVSGFENTGVPKDEGQHLQSVFKAANKHGGPGKFAFDPSAYLDEASSIFTPANKEQLLKEWLPHWDLEKTILIEKSPPNLVRMRFFQALFPNAKFITIFRHPIAVSYATLKWAKTSIPQLLDHWLVAHQQYRDDLKSVRQEIHFSYEEMVSQPTKVLGMIGAFLGKELTYDNQFKNSNEKYFSMWKKGSGILDWKHKMERRRLIKE